MLRILLLPYRRVPVVSKNLNSSILPNSAAKWEARLMTWVKNNSPRTGAEFSTVNLLADNYTIRTTDFVLDYFPSGRKELGLIRMGDISNPNLTVAFDDFYIQILGGH